MSRRFSHGGSDQILRQSSLCSKSCKPPRRRLQCHEAARSSDSWYEESAGTGISWLCCDYANCQLQGVLTAWINLLRKLHQNGAYHLLIVTLYFIALSYSHISQLTESSPIWKYESATWSHCKDLQHYARSGKIGLCNIEQTVSQKQLMCVVADSCDRRWEVETFEPIPEKRGIRKARTNACRAFLPPAWTTTSQFGPQISRQVALSHVCHHTQQIRISLCAVKVIKLTSAAHVYCEVWRLCITETRLRCFQTIWQCPVTIIRSKPIIPIWHNLV